MIRKATIWLVYAETGVKCLEMAAIVARLVDEEYRVKKELPCYGSPRYLADDIIMCGWRLDDK